MREKGDIAVVDASVIIVLIGRTTTDDQRARRERVEECMRGLEADGAKFVVPAPAVAELFRDEDGTDAARKALEARSGGLQVEAFDLLAATATGRILRNALRQATDSRVAMKYDAMIAGVAHALEAKYLVTTNGRDFKRHLSQVQSKVAVVEADGIPERGQLRLVHAKPQS